MKFKLLSPSKLRVAPERDWEIQVRCLDVLSSRSGRRGSNLQKITALVELAKLPSLYDSTWDRVESILKRGSGDLLNAALTVVASQKRPPDIVLKTVIELPNNEWSLETDLSQRVIATLSAVSRKTDEEGESVMRALLDIANVKSQYHRTEEYREVEILKNVFSNNFPNFFGVTVKTGKPFGIEFLVSETSSKGIEYAYSPKNKECTLYMPEGEVKVAITPAQMGGFLETMSVKYPDLPTKYGINF
jgi:hypothetical protein